MFVDDRESRREVSDQSQPKKPPISTGGAEAWATTEMQAPAPHQPSLAKVLLTSTADDRHLVWYLKPSKTVAQRRARSTRELDETARESYQCPTQLETPRRTLETEQTATLLTSIAISIATFTF
jgi:hypothetical protein